jgi:HTH-type transcriptional regulator/antitoxin HigA
MQKQDEFDALAQNALMPSEIWESQKPTDPSSIRAHARDLNISPCVIAGRLRYKAGDHMLFGTLFREKISF